MTSEQETIVAAIVGAVDGVLATRLEAAVAPLVEAVVTLQNNQRGIIEAVNGLAETVASLQRGQQTLTEAVEMLAERLGGVENRLGDFIEARLAALEARGTANDRH
jgi:hypothetical protein